MLFSRTGWWRAVLPALLIGCGSEVAPPTRTESSAAIGEARPVEKPAEPPFQLEDGFERLSFADFAAFSTDETAPTPWAETTDGLKCSGVPPGYLYSTKPYQNFTWRLEYRYPRPEKLPDESKFKGNTGFLVYITGDHKLWPICLEVQGKYVEMAAIRENGGAQPVTAKDDAEARQKARKPVGEWNALEIISRDGALSVSLNGTPVSKSEPDFLSEGLIGIQAEKTPFEVRRIRIRRD